MANTHVGCIDCDGMADITRREELGSRITLGRSTRLLKSIKDCDQRAGILLQAPRTRKRWHPMNCAAYDGHADHGVFSWIKQYW